MKTNKQRSKKWSLAIVSLTVFCLPVKPALANVSYILDDFDMSPAYAPNYAQLNDFNGNKGLWNSPGAVITPSFDSTERHDADGYSLKLEYDVTAAGSYGGYWEQFAYKYPDPDHPDDHDPAFDMSEFDEFHFWIKGVASFTSKCYIEFVDKAGHKAQVEITGIDSSWKEKVITDLQHLPADQGFDWTKMKQWAIVIKHDHVDAQVGTLYLDDLSFVDTHESFTTDDEFLELVSKRVFRFFWDTAHPATGLMRDRLASRNVSSTASIGFGLTTYCIAAERGWKTRSEIADEVKKVLTTLWNTPQGDGAADISGYKGFFYHMLNIDTGTRNNISELSSIDSALLLAGVLTCKEYFTGADPVETEIRTLADAIYRRVDWTYMLDAATNHFWMEWKPESGFAGHWDYTTSEARLVNLLAVGSPTFPVDSSVFYAWTREQGTYGDHALYQNQYGQMYLYLFDHMWIDYRGLTDRHPKVPVNWWNNDVQGIKAHRQFFIDNAATHETYGENSWGHTACFAPDGTYEADADGAKVRIPPAPQTIFHRGTIPPCAAGMSIAHFPYGSSNPALLALKHYYTYPKLWSLWGFRDAYNLSMADPDNYGYTHDIVGIDAGAMAIAIENYRSRFVWDTFMKNPYIKNALAAVFNKTGDIYYPREAETYQSKSGGREEYQSNASAGKVLHLGGDSGNTSDGQGDEAIYNINVDWTSSDAVFKVRYSDDVAGNVIEVYLDNALKGTFTTEDTGTWNDFAWDSELIKLGPMKAGAHTIKLRVATGGSWGVNLDAFVLQDAKNGSRILAPIYLLLLKH
ncbi:glucoamylase family protein [Candidatus Electronema sp. PJ]|uniref:glucoamylase family protein n=1 Tax=Candidatus Electronema sp. PJ TaxID=3401572 RepID=UPI003AA85804